MFYSNLDFWEKLNIWSEISQKMQYITDKYFEIISIRISYVSFKAWNVQRLSANNFNKKQFWENWNGNFVQLNIMTIFTNLYEILGKTGGEIYLRFKAGATILTYEIWRKKCNNDFPTFKCTYLWWICRVIWRTSVINALLYPY